MLPVLGTAPAQEHGSCPHTARAPSRHSKGHGAHPCTAAAPCMHRAGCCTAHIPSGHGSDLTRTAQILSLQGTDPPCAWHSARPCTARIPPRRASAPCTLSPDFAPAQPRSHPCRRGSHPAGSSPVPTQRSSTRPRAGIQPRPSPGLPPRSPGPIPARAASPDAPALPCPGAAPLAHGRAPPAPSAPTRRTAEPSGSAVLGAGAALASRGRAVTHAPCGSILGRGGRRDTPARPSPAQAELSRMRRSREAAAAPEAPAPCPRPRARSHRGALTSRTQPAAASRAPGWPRAACPIPSPRPAGGTRGAPSAAPTARRPAHRGARQTRQPGPRGAAQRLGGGSGPVGGGQPWPRVPRLSCCCWRQSLTETEMGEAQDGLRPQHQTDSARGLPRDPPGPPPSALGPPKLRAWPPRGPAHLQGLEDGFGAVLVGLLGWELCLLELQELAPEDLPKRGQLQGGSHRGQPRGGSCRGAAQTPGPMRPAVGHKPGPRSPSSPLPAGCQPNLTTSHGCLHTSARLGGNSGNPPPHCPWHAEPAGRKGPGGEARVCRG